MDYEGATGFVCIFVGGAQSLNSLPHHTPLGNDRPGNPKYMEFYV